MTHANADLTPRGRLALAKLVVEDGWLYRRAAECAPAAAHKWSQRFRAEGEAHDRSFLTSAFVPHQTPTRTERRIIGLRFCRRWGPHRIAYHLHLAISTVEAVLRATRCPGSPTSTRSPGCRCAGHRHAATSTMHRETWSTSTSRNSAASRTAADTAKSAAPPDDAIAPESATRICTTPSTITPGSRTRRFCAMGRRRPPLGSGPDRTTSSQPITSRSREC